jgi:hypothetical protein
LRESIGRGVGVRRERAAVVIETRQSTALSRDPQFAIAAGNGVDDIFVQTGACNATGSRAFQPK